MDVLRNLHNVPIWVSALIARRIRGLFNYGASQSTPKALVQEISVQEWKQQMRGRLSILEETMDPLVAASIYNIDYSPIYRLPPEILLIIIRQLFNDAPTFFCLRQVSRLFRELINNKEFQGHIFPTYYEWDDGLNTPGVWYWMNAAISFNIAITYQRAAHRPLIKEIGTRLRRDRLCLTCQENYNSRPKANLPGRCKLFPLKGSYIHCSGCGHDHAQPMFSAAQQRARWNQRICLGREGYVRLCEHTVITWADIEPHLIEWNAKPHMNLEDCDVTIKCCTDETHNFGCGYKTSAPFARLMCEEPGTAMLQLTWHPHTGPSNFTRSAGGEILASEIRTLARKYRQNAARFIVPEEAAGHLPEMECFPFGYCDCLHYVGPDDYNGIDNFDSNQSSSSSSTTSLTTSSTTSSTTGRQHGRLGMTRTFCGHLRSTLWNYSLRSLIAMRQCRSSFHDPRSVCIETQYTKTIYVGQRSHKNNSPGDSWFHALDPDSFVGDESCTRLERCKDASCTNHYAADMGNHESRPAAHKQCGDNCMVSRGSASTAGGD